MSLFLNASWNLDGLDESFWRRPIGVEHVNWLIKVCNIVQENPIHSLRQCSSSLFVLLFQRLLNFPIPDLELEPNTQEKKLWNMTRVLTELSLVGETDLSYISASEIVNCNEEHISLLVRVFLQLALHLIRAQQQQPQQQPQQQQQPTEDEMWALRRPAPPPGLSTTTATTATSGSGVPGVMTGTGRAAHTLHQSHPPVLRPPPPHQHLHHHHHHHHYATPHAHLHPSTDTNDSQADDGDEPIVEENVEEVEDGEDGGQTPPPEEQAPERPHDSDLRATSLAALKAMGAASHRRPVLGDGHGGGGDAASSVSEADSAVFTNELVQGWKRSLVPPHQRRRGGSVDPIALAQVRQRIEQLETSLLNRSGKKPVRPQEHNSRHHAVREAANRLICNRQRVAVQNRQRDATIERLRCERLQKELQQVLLSEVVAKRSVAEVELVQAFRDAVALEEERKHYAMKQLRDEDARLRSAVTSLVASERNRLRLDSAYLTEETARVAAHHMAAVREARRSLNEQRKANHRSAMESVDAYGRVISSWRPALLV